MASDWRSGGWWSRVVVSALASINEVNQCRTRLVLRWVTVSGFNSRCGTFTSVCDQPSRSTQPGHPFVGRRNEYQRKGGDALRLGSKGRYGSCVDGVCGCVIPLLHAGHI